MWGCDRWWTLDAFCFSYTHAGLWHLFSLIALFPMYDHGAAPQTKQLDFFLHNVSSGGPPQSPLPDVPAQLTFAHAAFRRIDAYSKFFSEDAVRRAGARLLLGARHSAPSPGTKPPRPRQICKGGVTPMLPRPLPFAVNPRGGRYLKTKLALRGASWHSARWVSYVLLRTSDVADWLLRTGRRHPRMPLVTHASNPRCGPTV